MADEHRTAEEIFYEALELDESAREAFLDEVCGNNPELRKEVQDLLANHRKAGDFLDAPAAVVPTEALPVAEKPGEQIGRYKLLEQIGEGGMGVVFMAEQQSPVRRKVALKIIKPGMDSKEVIARFEAERQALAMMDHPNIARVFDAGATATGRPFFVMELVRGVPITTFCDRNKLSADERLQLFVKVCQAVQHAHQKGIIHRDIKPTNILVTMHDDEPVPKVIDFGVAKATNARLTERTLFTRFAQMIGTPLYMSPEQAQMSGLDVDTRSDVYSLGVLLYELLTGTTPFGQEQIREAAQDELLRMIREQEPPRPSLRISSLGETLPDVAASRQIEPDKLASLVRGELDWIVMKAMEKNRSRRYETAAALASDLQRYLDDDPVEACPPSISYRFAKFARRNKVILSAACSFTIVLILGILGTSWYAVAAHRAGDREVAARIDAESARAEAEELSERRRRLLYIADMNRAAEAWQRNDIIRALELLNGHCPEEGEQDLRGIEWYFIQRGCEESRRVDKRIPLSYGAMRMAISPADGALVAGLHNNSIDVVSSSPEDTQNFGPANRLWLQTSVCFSCDGCWLFSPAADPSKISMRQWPSCQESKQLESHEFDVVAICAAPAANLLASADKSGVICLWDSSTGKKLHSEAAHSSDIVSMAFTKDGSRLVSGGYDSIVKVWHWDGAELSLELEYQEHAGRVAAVSFSNDARFVASGGDKNIIIWDTHEDTRHARLTGHTDCLRSLEFSSDDMNLLSAGRDKSVRLWEVATGRLLMTKSPHSSITTTAKFLDDNTVASVGFEGTLAVWRIEENIKSLRFDVGGAIADVAFTSDGQDLLAIRSSPNALIRRSLDTDIDKDLSVDQETSCLAMSSEDVLAIGQFDGRVALYEYPAMSRLNELGMPTKAPICQLAFNPQDPTCLASYEDGGFVRIWNTVTGRQVREFPCVQPALKRAESVGMLAFAHDGRRLAWVDGDREIVLHDFEHGMIRFPDLHEKNVLTVVFSPDGRMLASSDWGGAVRLWSIDYENATTRAIGVLQHPMWVRGLTFSPDGTSLVVASGDGTIRFWDIALKKQMGAIAAPAMACLRFSPDGKMLAGGGARGVISIFRRD